MQSENHVNGVLPHGRPTTQLQVNREGRKPLFSSTTAAASDAGDKGLESRRPGLGRVGSGNANAIDDGSASLQRAKSASESLLSSRRESITGGHSPGGTRIPRPSSSLSFTRRKPMSLSEAMKLAEDEEDAAKEMAVTEIIDHQPVDGSPSPAPRPWRSRNASDESKIRKMLDQDHLDSKGQNRRLSSRNSNLSGTLVGTGPGTSEEAAGEPAEVNTADETSAAVGSRFGAPRPNVNGETRIPDLVPGIEDIPLPSVEPAAAVANHTSPEKGFAWELEDDFTAGDLQVSDSPRVRVGTRPFAGRLEYDETGKLNLGKMPRLSNPGAHNTKLDEIRSREVREGGSNLPLLDRMPRKQPNTKLDEIRARESQVEQQIPIPSRHLERLRNTKLDEIRQREVDGISRRAFAAARLEEIKELNSMSRSKSPEEVRPRSSWGLVGPYSRSGITSKASEVPTKPKSAFEAGAGTRIPDTPVTIFKRDPRLAKDSSANAEITAVEEQHKEDIALEVPATQQKRADDRELLRRLARAASSSPVVAETKSQQLPTPPPGDFESTKSTHVVLDKPASDLVLPRLESAVSRRAARNAIKDSDRVRPSVDFVGLQRTQSTESARSKRSSMQSETDPTDRIEAEMKLFAPADNHSKRGSIRASSPTTDSDEEDGGEKDTFDATPRAPKLDPLTMPTPKVIGAYVETPATVKVERIGKGEEQKPLPVKTKSRPEEKPLQYEPPAPILRERKTTLAWRNKDQDTASDPGAADESDIGVTTSAAVRRPRAKSLPRRRPPVKNSAKPPSVKDDLLELQRAYNIEDSTFDDLDEIISGRKPLSAELEKHLPSRLSADDFDLDLDLALDQKSDAPASSIKKERKSSAEVEEPGGELAIIDRMNKSLQTGLLGIRSAKQVIERIEGQFSQAKPQPDSKFGDKMSTPDIPEDHEHHTHQTPAEGCPYCPDSASTSVTYLHLALPRLFRRKPTFRLTFLGLLVAILSLWYSAESAMCSMYCRPSTCPESKSPCVWSFDDPTSFGTALPIKIDQWITGGHGRQFSSMAIEELHDWAADMQDLALGRDITDVHLESLTPEQRRHHRRRLRKKGLTKPPREPLPEERAKWDAWHQTRLAKERAKQARMQGYEIDVDGDAATVGGDQRVY